MQIAFEISMPQRREHFQAKLIADLLKLQDKYKISLVGEGGEYETKVLNCPLFKKRIEILQSEKKWFGNWGVLVVKEAKLC